MNILLVIVRKKCFSYMVKSSVQTTRSSYLAEYFQRDSISSIATKWYYDENFRTGREKSSHHGKLK